MTVKGKQHILQLNAHVRTQKYVYHDLAKDDGGGSDRYGSPARINRHIVMQIILLHFSKTEIADQLNLLTRSVFPVRSYLFMRIMIYIFHPDSDSSFYLLCHVNIKLIRSGTSNFQIT